MHSDDQGSPPLDRKPLSRKSRAKIKSELMVGVTEEIKAALEIAVDFSGMKASQYGRQAILEKLVREGYLKHPGMARFENNGVAVAAE